MARKNKSVYVCAECGASSARWLGKCAACGAWDSLSEEAVRETAESSGKASRSILSSGGVKPITEVENDASCRLPTGEGELDRILGGGLVPGSAVLLGGDPGIGKSTILLQAAARLAKAMSAPVLYVTAEESARQLRLRAERLDALDPNLLCLAENNVEVILRAAEECDAQMLIVDSIQMVYWPGMDSAPGSVGQVRECAAGLIAQAKRRDCPVFLVGHVTKDGAIAGPRVLEHMVDVVLYFEGERHHSARILRAVKNRFGACGEIGVFEMAGQGLVPVRDPSRLFLSGRDGGGEGAVVTASMEGSRPFLVEVQSLVASGAPQGAKRRISGADGNRVSMLLAVLEKRCELTLFDQDVFVNVVGGVQLDDPGSDLAVALAIGGSFKERALPAGTLALGEVGLGGEVRPVHSILPRVKEAERLGFKRVILAQENAEACKGVKLEFVKVRHIDEALAELCSAAGRA